MTQCTRNQLRRDWWPVQRGSLQSHCRGILVKLVMVASRGHWKNSIQTSWEKYSFSYLVPVYTDSNKKTTTVYLIAPFENILCIILTFQLSPWNTKKSKLFIKWHFWVTLYLYILILASKNIWPPHITYNKYVYNHSKKFLCPPVFHGDIIQKLGFRHLDLDI